MGNGPGGMNIYDELAERYPRLHGGFVWEWRDHGLLTHTPDGVEYYAYGGDFGEVVHDGNFVMDGMLLPDGTPTPSLAEFMRVNQPILFDLDGGGLTVRNRYHSLSTEHLALSLSERWMDIRLPRRRSKWRRFPRASRERSRCLRSW